MSIGSTIQIISDRLFAARAWQGVSEKLSAGSDLAVAAPISVRPLLVAAVFARSPRTTLVLISGEAAAEQFSRELRGWLDADTVLQLPLASHQPWRGLLLTTEQIAQNGRRSEALLALTDPTPRIVVANIQALLRRLPPVDQLPQPLRLQTEATGISNLDYAGCQQTLLNLGYERVERVTAAGQFSRRGDTLDIWSAGALYPARVEYFGDEVERIRRLVPATGQSIGTLTSLDVYPAQSQALTEATRQRAIRRIYGLPAADLVQLPASYVEQLNALQSGINFPEQELYQAYFYDSLVNPLDYLASKALLVGIEPRSLFDTANRYYDEQAASIENHAHQPERSRAFRQALFCSPAELDFGQHQLLSLQTLIGGGSSLDLRLEVKHPTINGSAERLASTAAALLQDNYLAIVAERKPQSLAEIKLALVDAHVSYVSQPEASAINPKIALLVEQELPVAMIIPTARLALLGLNDNSASSVARRVRGRGGVAHSGSSTSDPTTLTFPFQPGDYVVHEVHGIALFKAIVRQEVAGVERDYLQLEYAQGDRLFTPMEQIDRVTRYVGPNSAAPRLTRLNTSDWSRATARARGAARQLAFDLVDLYARRATVQGFAYGPDTLMQQQMELAFPYQETADQLAAIADVKADMESSRPMDRLICGDVGFGKTEVALRAAMKAIQAGKQVMFLAPTTILAQQHYQTAADRFDPFAISVDVLSRFRSEAEQRQILQRFADGRLDMLIGTHRLLSADVNPRNLGLIIIDEEQRFGVQHKEQLKNLREQVDVLTLSATPIPRTLQMALSGVRDMSLINTPPPSRTPVHVQVGEWNEDVVSAAIRQEIGRGGQVYYVSNRVRSIDDAVARVFAAAPEARVAVAHGQLSGRALEDIMERFAAGEIDVLIATTIIESGLDNPHTNTLIIEDSQRLGLAQLYQLKGRVGRSHSQAYAYFLFPSEEQLTPEALERLTAIDEFQDLGSGLKIAMRDLEIRGAGSLLGAEQSGNISAVGFDLFASMINEAIQVARSGELATAQDGSQKPAEKIRVDLSEPGYFPEEYLPAADQRVLYYRRLAAAGDLDTLDELQSRLEAEYGALPAVASNLIDRERSRVLAEQLGVTSITLQRHNFILENLQITSEQARVLKDQGALYYVKSQRLQYPAPKTTGQALYPALLNLLDGLASQAAEAAEKAG
ncbi:MAG: transcription-repair coupling factor [Actinomycetia bacterium]|nr:transcription-repair coupling factor [Actinomycetes bacterium]